MTATVDFSQWFSSVVAHPTPHDWQMELSDDAICRNRLIRVGTSLGKTEGVLAAWSFTAFVWRMIAGRDG